jgi:hypothetical protein
MDRFLSDRSRIGHAEVSEDSQPTNQGLITRRAAIGAALGGAFVTLLAGPEVAMAAETIEGGRMAPKAPLVLLLKGLFSPVVDGPDLGLSTVDLSDGSYSTTKIYPVIGTPGHTNVLEAIGDFYVQFTGTLCAYDLPGGAIAMEFTPNSNLISVPDGCGGSFLHGTYELRIPEANGAFRSFAGGRNHMVDNLRFLASGDVDEYCFCFIFRK